MKHLAKRASSQATRRQNRVREVDASLIHSETESTVQGKPVKKPETRNKRLKTAGNPKLSHLLFTTADAKIPLSVVQVKHEPQDVVFVALRRDHFGQPQHSAVQNGKTRVGRGF